MSDFSIMSLLPTISINKWMGLLWAHCCHLPFLDTDIYTRPDFSLHHTVNRKLTHANLYLNATLHCYVVSKHSVLSALAHRTRVVCNQESLPGELELLCRMFRQTATVTGRSIELSVYLKRIWYWWPPSSLLDVPSITLAGCYLNIISKL
jgi:hypothetical protein